MYRLIRVLSWGIAFFCSLNVFVHITRLSFTKKLASKGRLWSYVVALPFSALNLYFMKDVFTTVWICLLHVSLILTVFDIVYLVIRLFGRDTRVIRVFRRLTGWGLAFLLSAAIIAYGLINVGIVRKTEYTLYNPNVKGEITIGLVSDLHLGTAMNEDKFIAVIDEMLLGGADMIVLAGDMTDERTDPDAFYRLMDMLSTRRALKGMYFVFGNHDGSRYGGRLSAQNMEKALTNAGITVLTDESIFLDGWLRICGRRDVNERNRMKPGDLLAEADPENEFIVLIDHQPAQTDASAQAGTDLLLSGHTHNGQIWPIGPISKLAGFNEIEYGHEKIGDMDAVVSSGVAGWGCAFRTGGISEYVLITVTGDGV